MRRLLLCLWISLVLPLSAAGAQAPASDPNAAAQAFRAGVAAAQAGRWQEALDAFDLSYRLRAHPNTLLNLAGAQAQTGRVVEAVATYRRFLAEFPASASNEAMRAAASQYATKLEAKVAHLSITVEKGEPGDLLRIDGNAGTPAQPHEELPMNPGKHHLQVDRNGRPVVTQDITLAEAEKASVTLTATLVPSAADIAAAERMLPPREAPKVDEPTVFETWWFWTAVGVVVVGGAVVAGVLLSDGGEPVDPGNLGTTAVPKP